MHTKLEKIPKINKSCLIIKKEKKIAISSHEKPETIYLSPYRAVKYVFVDISENETFKTPERFRVYATRKKNSRESRAGGGTDRRSGRGGGL